MPCNYFQKIITSSDGGLNRIAFNTEEPVIVVGDTAGVIHSLKLSPNLRKKTKEILRAIQNNSPREVRLVSLYPASCFHNSILSREAEIKKLEKILSQIIYKIAI